MKVPTLIQHLCNHNPTTAAKVLNHANKNPVPILLAELLSIISWRAKLILISWTDAGWALVFEAEGRRVGADDAGWPFEAFEEEGRREGRRDGADDTDGPFEGVMEALEPFPDLLPALEPLPDFPTTPFSAPFPALPACANDADVWSLACLSLRTPAAMAMATLATATEATMNFSAFLLTIADR